MIPGITIIVPTVGEDTLPNTLESVAPQLGPTDRCVVVVDGPSERENWHNEYRDRFLWLYQAERRGAYGHPSRNHALEKHVKTTHVWTIDADDEAAPGALNAMRNHYNDPWTIFRMHFGPGHYANGVTLPHTHRVAHGNIGTPMIFAPLTPARFGHHYSGDYDYATELEQHQGPPVWDDTIVAIIRP